MRPAAGHVERPVESPRQQSEHHWLHYRRGRPNQRLGTGLRRAQHRGCARDARGRACRRFPQRSRNASWCSHARWARAEARASTTPTAGREFQAAAGAGFRWCRPDGVGRAASGQSGPEPARPSQARSSMRMASRMAPSVKRSHSAGVMSPRSARSRNVAQVCSSAASTVSTVITVPTSTRGIPPGVTGRGRGFGPHRGPWLRLPFNGRHAHSGKPGPRPDDSQPRRWWEALTGRSDDHSGGGAPPGRGGAPPPL
jgi:hypothetical protein